MKAFGQPSNLAVAFVSILRFLPVPLTDWIFDRLGGERTEFARNTSSLAISVAKTLVDAKQAALDEGSDSADFITMCLKANAQPNSKAKLSEAEVLSEIG
jgi:hypothetical protein